MLVLWCGGKFGYNYTIRYIWVENKIVWAGVSEFHPNDGVDSLQHVRNGEVDIIIQDSDGVRSGVY